MKRTQLRCLNLAACLALATLLPAPAPAAEKPPVHSRDLLALAGPCSAETFAKVASGLPVLCWERSAIQEVMTGKLLGKTLASVGGEGDRKVDFSKQEVAELLRSEGGKGDAKGACVAQVAAILAAGGTVTYDRKAHPRCTITRVPADALRAIFVEIHF